MAKKSKTGVLKRLREVKKAEKAALKREELRIRKETGGGPSRVEEEKVEPQVATVDESSPPGRAWKSLEPSPMMIDPSGSQA